MITIRRSEDRGHADHGWLDSHHTFSFADYHDPAHMGFGDLRVINDDRVAGGGGFPTHPHRDMEIISYVVEGGLQHRDSMGNGSAMYPGEVQRMSAGTGVTHSEMNTSPSDGLRFLQIWIIPEKTGIEPGYEQKDFGEERQNRLRLVASRNGADGSVRLHQDVDVYASMLESGTTLSHAVAPDRQVWVQVVDGEVQVGGELLRAGDGAAIVDEEELQFLSPSDGHFLLFDLKRG